MESLPVELQFYVFPFLSTPALVHAQSVCKAWYQEIANPYSTEYWQDRVGPADVLEALRCNAPRSCMWLLAHRSIYRDHSHVEMYLRIACERGAIELAAIIAERYRDYPETLQRAYTGGLHGAISCEQKSMIIWLHQCKLRICPEAWGPKIIVERILITGKYELAKWYLDLYWQDFLEPRVIDNLFLNASVLMPFATFKWLIEYFGCSPDNTKFAKKIIEFHLTFRCREDLILYVWEYFKLHKLAPRVSRKLIDTIHVKSVKDAVKSYVSKCTSSQMYNK
jgi:hypothetical protein